MELEKAIEDKLREINQQEVQTHANFKKIFDDYFTLLISFNSNKRLLIELLNPEESVPEDTEEDSVSENTTE